ncbi:MAG: hypothetical protein PHX27_02095 [Candidatus ainarchaeum sp.]|nr:hypothetical protein [Candidatus ainarchaeum sp.]
MQEKTKAFLKSRGFHLFSALVAAVLLTTGFILWNMLISTEETIGREVYIITNNFNLSDAAAIARADALQTFNYNFRKQLEEYLTVSEEDIQRNVKFNLIDTDDIRSGETWENLKTNFENSILLKGNMIVDANGNEQTNNTFNAAIELVAKKTINQFHDGSYGKYHISLSSREQNAITNLENAIVQTIENNINEIDFLDIVGCDADTCDVGTFYFIIPLDKMSPEAYESLPLIIVKDLVSGEEIKFPILQKTRLNIYVPLRFFKAVHEAWQKNSGAIIEFEDLLYNGQTIKTGMLGYCDTGCEPRTNPLIAGGENWGKNCMEPGTKTLTQLITENNNANILLSSKNYTIGIANGRNELTAFARANICVNAENKYIETGYTNPGRLDNIGTFVNYNLEEGRGINAESSMGIVKASGCPFNKIYAVSQSKNTKIIDGALGTELKLDCSSIKQVETTVIFEDTNPLYIVSGEKNRYAIGIRSKEFPIQDKELGTCTNGEEKCIKK